MASSSSGNYIAMPPVSLTGILLSVTTKHLKDTHYQLDKKRMKFIARIIATLAFIFLVPFAKFYNFCCILWKGSCYAYGSLRNKNIGVHPPQKYLEESLKHLLCFATDLAMTAIWLIAAPAIVIDPKIVPRILNKNLEMLTSEKDNLGILGIG